MSANDPKRTSAVRQQAVKIDRIAFIVGGNSMDIWWLLFAVGFIAQLIDGFGIGFLD
jgi:hypothetical protein